MREKMIPTNIIKRREALSNAKEHVFILAELGKPPFEYVGFKRSSNECFRCECCKTKIINLHNIKSSDGKIFYVGKECITWSKDSHLIEPMKQNDIIVKASVRLKRLSHRILKFNELMETKSFRKSLSIIKHPKSNSDKKFETKTFLNFIEERNESKKSINETILIICNTLQIKI